MPIPEQLADRIAALAANNTSGASALLHEAIDILTAARASGADIRAIARAVRDAQPTMAPLSNAAEAALSPDPDHLTQFARRVRRAPAALARFAAAHFGGDRQLRVVTLSFSGTVVTVLEAIRQTRPIHVACAESRPALEGRRLASALAMSGTPVTLYSDAAIAHALADADAVIVGADAVSPSWFLNKVGTRMLTAAAAQQGVPSYVVATRDKFVTDELAERLHERTPDPAEVWDAPPPGVEVHNAYFEATPLDLVTAVISDIGVLGTGMVPDVCARSRSFV